MSVRHDAAAPRRVCVAVLTYRRPDQLRALLPRLGAQAAGLADASGGAATGRVVVVDNDPQGSAGPVVTAYAAGSPVSATYAHEPAPGIATARNRALTEAAGDDAIVFIDDDEVPHPGWLAALVQVWCTGEVAAVAGRIVPDYLAGPDPWIEAGRFFVRATYPTGTPVLAASSANLLLDVATLTRLGLRFDSRAGFSGGEDTLLTRRLVAAGERLVHCAEAVVVDVVPASRTTRAWCLSRALSHGNTAALLAGGHPDTTPGIRRRVTIAAGGMARAAAGSARALLGVLLRDPRHQARGQRLIARGAGLTLGATGWRYQEYARPGPTGRVTRFTRV